MTCMVTNPSPIPSFAVALSEPTAQARPRFSICTLVTRHNEYAEMVQSFVDHGFSPTDCEYFYIDNSESNQFDAFRGYNLFLTEARGDFIILCHQDILLLEDGRTELEQQLAELTNRDPEWALCGNAGGISFNHLAIRITDRYGTDQARGHFPARTTALDENFIVIRRDANLAVSHDLDGFHLYGADLCIIADFLGRSAWVIDFHLLHKGIGQADANFYSVRKNVSRKYRRAFRSRWVITTVTYFFLSGSPALSRLLTWRALGIPRHLADRVRGIRAPKR
ncbi:MAG: hypothetical protein K2Q25_00030 [Mycobacteriaceae bacterium]|nr:hypothetical protein [Mycobacteriaceae bacterium]